MVIDTGAVASPIKRDEEIVFFPVAARLSADLEHWIVPLHGWVFEPEDESLWRRGALGALALSLGLEEGQPTPRSSRREAAGSWWTTKGASALP